MKLDKTLDLLLVFMKKEIENHGQSLIKVTFDFSFSETLQYMNAPDEIKFDGEDLTAFKKKTQLGDDSIRQTLNKALTDGYIKQKVHGDKYKALVLTELGSARAESVHYNQKTFYKRGLNYFTEKLIVPIVTAVLTAMIVNYISGDKTDKEIKQLQEDIKWLKTYQNKSN